MVNEAERTTVQLYKTTTQRLRKLGQRNEDYDSIINRAIDGEFCERSHYRETSLDRRVMSESQKKRRVAK
jgi:hypothetical protein